MPVKNAYTKVEVLKTIQDIETVLVRYGAQQINKSYRGGKVTGISFVYETPLGRLAYEVPVNEQAIWDYYLDNGDASGVPKYYRTREQAARVAWRTAYDWLKLQLDFIETGVVKFEKAMFGYLLQPGTNNTYFDAMVTDRLRALAAPKAAE